MLLGGVIAVVIADSGDDHFCLVDRFASGSNFDLNGRWLVLCDDAWRLDRHQDTDRNKQRTHIPLRSDAVRTRATCFSCSGTRGASGAAVIPACPIFPLFAHWTPRR